MACFPLDYHLPLVVNPRCGQAAACLVLGHHLGGALLLEVLRDSFLQWEEEKVFGRPMVTINEVLRLQRGCEEVTAQRTIVEQQAEAEAEATEERTVEEFLEAQAV